MGSLNIQITDMAGAYIEHSMVISNFLIKAGSQMQDNLCRIFGDNVQYKWEVNGEEKAVIPDVSINCRFRHRRGNSFFNNPRFTGSRKLMNTGLLTGAGNKLKYMCWTMTRESRSIILFVWSLRKIKKN